MAMDNLTLQVQIPADANELPGDLYNSPKAANVEVLGQLYPRVRRFALDLSAFRGRNIILDITMDAGPDANYDMIMWPELKIYTKA